MNDRKHVATCRTDGCENQGIGIELVNPEQLIVCGPCGEFIDDVVPPVPEVAELIEGG